MDVLIVASTVVGETLRDVHLAHLGVRGTLVAHAGGVGELARRTDLPHFDLVVLEGSFLQNGVSPARVLRNLHRIAPKATLMVFVDDPRLWPAVLANASHRDLRALVYQPGSLREFVPYIGTAARALLRARSNRKPRT